MKMVLNIIGVLIGLVGAVWLGQGVGLIKGSFMTDQSMWAIIGVIMLVVSIGLLFYTNRRRIQA